MNNPELKDKYDTLEKMREAIDQRFKDGEVITTKTIQKVVSEIRYDAPRRAARLAKEEEKRLAAEKNRMTLNKFVKKFVEDIASGARQTDKGTNYCYDTVRAIRGAMNQFAYYQRDCHKNVDFDDVDMPFYYAFTEYLKKKNYSINTIGKVIANLKAILRVAYDEGFTNNRKWESRKFKATRTEVDTIYLTEEDLKKIMEVDLSEKEKAYEQVRDVFMIGVRLAQRVSDYNYLTEDMITTMTKHSIVEDPDPDNPGKTIPRIVTKEVYVANILQEKTNKRVTVPCHPQVVQILQKYNYHMPKLADHTINDYIKEIGEMAKLTDKIEIIETKGGVENRVFKKKYEMITTHTARRTGATLMYLAGMDCWDIMKMTGHDSPTNLKKYIKDDELQVVETIVNKYNYFD